VFSVLAWLVFGALLVGRYRYGWRGRIALRWILAGGGLLLLAGMAVLATLFSVTVVRRGRGA